jgi:hypothetical protein
MGQFAEAAIVGVGVEDFVSQIDETADGVAVSVVDKDKFHCCGIEGYLFKGW